MILRQAVRVALVVLAFAVTILTGSGPASAHNDVRFNGDDYAGPETTTNSLLALATIEWWP
jgi:hypothetical protein